VHFDTTIKWTEEQLRNAASLSYSYAFNGPELAVTVKVKNLSGHKLPTGIPLRRMWINFEMYGLDDTLMFTSGRWDSLGHIEWLDSVPEPHHQEINRLEQVQIYEGVMQDINGDVTYTLLRGADFIKDNRLPPEGYADNHSLYDAVKIVGRAAADADFNRAGSIQGSGEDAVVYRHPGALASRYQVIVRLCYQSVNPGFYDHLCTLDTPEIRRYKAIYESGDKTPFIMDSLSFITQRTVALENGEGKGGPLNDLKLVSPTARPVFTMNLAAQTVFNIRIYDIRGRMVESVVNLHFNAGTCRWMSKRQWSPGIYIFKLDNRDYRHTQRFLIIQ
jgi:hypothetical protein